MKRLFALLLTALQLIVLFSVGTIGTTVFATGGDFTGITFTDVEYSPSLGKFVAIGNDSSSGKIFVSSDGVNWIASAPLTAGQKFQAHPYAMIWNPVMEKFIVLRDDNKTKCMVSSDGFIWTEEEIGTQYVRSIMWDDVGQRMLICRTSNTDENTDHDLYISTARTFPLYSGTATAVGKTKWVTSIYPVFISNGTNSVMVASRDAGSRLNKSTDTWEIINEEADLGRFNTRTYDVVYSSELDAYISAYYDGYSSDSQKRKMSIISPSKAADYMTYVTIDGINDDNDFASGTSTAICIGNGSIILGASNGVLRKIPEAGLSASSKNFSKMTGGYTGRINAIAYGVGKFVAVGNNAILGFGESDNTYTMATTYQVKSLNNDIETFVVSGQSATIDTDNHTAFVLLPKGTDITNLMPTITVSDGATINPASGTARNFTKPVTYTVTSEAGGAQKWTVTVSNKNDITGSTFYDVAYGNGKFVATGIVGAVRKVFVSEDGESWMLANITDGWYNYQSHSNSIIWNSVMQKFIILRSSDNNDTCIVSSDGINWESKSIGKTKICSITWDGTRMIIGRTNDASTNNFDLYISTATDFPLIAGDAEPAGTAQPSGGTGWAGAVPMFISDGKNSILSMTQEKGAFSSNNGTSWTTGLNIYGRDVVYSERLDRFIIAHFNSNYDTANTPPTWDNRTRKVMVYPTGDTGSPSNVIGNSNAICIGSDKIIIATDSGKIYKATETGFSTSSTFTEITEGNGSNASRINAIVYGNGKFVAVGNGAALSFGVNDTEYTSARDYADFTIKYTITEPVLDVGTLTPSAPVTGSVNVSSNASSNIDIRLVMALYNSSGELEMVAISDNDSPLSVGVTSKPVSASFTPDEVEGRYIKVFVWDGINSMKPLREGKEFFKQ